jgi:uncharacterized membrane protein
MSSLTAWRFAGTEGADAAVLRLKQLDGQDLIDLEDVAVIRWPLYAGQPAAAEHATDEGGMVSAMAKKLRKSVIDSSMVESVKGDLTPGTSAVVLLTSGAVIDTIAQAFRGQSMELIRSDLSVPEQDQVRAAFRDPSPGAGPQGGR